MLKIGGGGCSLSPFFKPIVCSFAYLLMCSGLELVPFCWPMLAWGACPTLQSQGAGHGGFCSRGCKSVRASCCQRCLGNVPHLQGQGGGAWIAEAWGRRPTVKGKGLEQLSAELWGGARSTIEGKGVGHGAIMPEISPHCGGQEGWGME